MNTTRGFTLIELIVAMTIFITIMTISMGSIVNVFEANRQSRAMKIVVSNLNLALETMSREMRFGRNYECGFFSDPQFPDCSSGGNNIVTFLSSENQEITYRQEGTRIEKKINNGAWIAVTAPEIVIDELKFFVNGAEAGDLLQPRVLIQIQSHSGEGENRSDFVLQTLVSQRATDF